MGSDSFSLSILARLLADGPALPIPVNTVGVVSRPDRLAGRGRRLRPNPVKELAEASGVPALQPEEVRASESLEKILELQPHLIVVASFGQFLPRMLLDTPIHGCLNVHPSLLPRGRGPTPIPAAILTGERETGTTLMKMVMKMDAGPIVSQIATEIMPRETAGELRARLATISSELLMRDLPPLLGGQLKPRDQVEALATYTPLISKADGLIDWRLSADTLARQVRAYNPWPISYTSWSGVRLRILRATVADGAGNPGSVLGLDELGLRIATGSDVLCAQELQLAGGRVLRARELVLGHPGLLRAELGN
jgi:methionyl-tRNA formyltransferase